MLVVTVDIDWASEGAIEETVRLLFDRGITPTLFTTHHSRIIETILDKVEVGLHPFFDPNSSQGNTFDSIVSFVMDIPHNVPAFRCHRYGSCNLSNQMMVEAGMRIASNVCTDLELITPFIDRYGLIQAPIFLEDGGYLWRGHCLEKSFIPLDNKLYIINIHPMHFVLNTPHFNYMVDIKKMLSRQQWTNLSSDQIKSLRHKGRGIRDVIIDLIGRFDQSGPLVKTLAKSPRFSKMIAEGKESSLVQ